ncbi:MAG: hypothetical protein KZQ64_14520 [gamma proteobacterium symbiont of Bathyaustriella thionipta]|nr:hypothetical protein [gamma proteobacterium symbiont of Bathyaustriella thionipta]MCU7950693.1 hypothetical protein [gamma proteobacterium symbiont of Bathyaustriella thionipta]MCU7954583.1 hypothetical protein [gamma proteobacterium symbiont of Bathyaustriella thionipta]MCU7957201.1 hypothetical protein [gamma proteobacterium symbiont of Bathyaustriella thionipta]MCU7968260.1 hypothetical protein [gamma proteobacterium symbiont of Bathyaustriella thionipta]
MNKARKNILQRLRQHQLTNPVNAKIPVYKPEYDWDKEQRITKFSQFLQAVHAQVFRLKHKHWTEKLFQILEQQGIAQILLSIDSSLAKEIQLNQPDNLQLIDYQAAMESRKKRNYSA